MNLAKEAEISLVQTLLAAGATDLDSTAVEMCGHRHATFIAIIGSQDAAATLAMQARDFNDIEFGSDVADIPGAVITSPVNADNKILVLTVRTRGKRYMHVAMTRGGTGNTQVGGILALLTGARLTPAAVNLLYHAATPVSA